MQIRLTGIAVAAIGAGLFPGAAAAQTIELTVTLPKLNVAEYHKPYVAVWLQKEGGPTNTLALWYDFDMKANEGTKWLNSIRRWWQAGGRNLKVPADGITGATRGPGSHKVNFTAGRGGMPALAPGKYKLNVEASRETGGIERVTLDFTWNGSSATVRGKGAAELGAITVNVKR